jgi:uncharacterized protein (DUF927 family)
MSSGRSKSPEQTAKDETEHKTALLKWADEIADAVIAAVLDDIALHFIEGDADDGEHSIDLTGDYDPIIDVQTGARLSETIRHAAEPLRTSEKILRRSYVSALKQKWANHRKEIPSEPSGTLYARSYLVNRHGVWSRLTIAGLGDLNVWRRIAKTRIDPEALCYDTTLTRNWQHRYLVSGETGRFPVDIAAEHLGKDANRAINTLMRRGVHIIESKQARQELAQFLRYRPRKRIIRAPRTGWFDCRRHQWVFVLPDGVLGATDKLHIILDGAARSGGYGFHRAGTSEQWQQYVAIPLAHNSNVVLAVGVFLAAPLLRWIDEPPGGFHSWGRTSIGKTLAAAVGQSLYGKPYRRGAQSDAFGFTWESTANRLEQRAVLRNDVGLGLDEIGIGFKKSIAATVYKLAGGLGKGRMNQDELDFNILFYSTGEIALADFLPNVQPGQMVRLADVPAEVQPGSAFETILEHEIIAESRKFYELLDEFHGSAGHEYLQHLVTLTPKEIKARVKNGRALFLARPEVVEIAKRADRQLTSVVGRFALLAAALAIAIEAGILPWTIADTDTGIIACMQRWVNQRGNVNEAGELLREIERRRNRFAATADDRLIRLAVDGRRRLVAASPTDERKLEAAEQFDGYVKNGRILLTPDGWKRLWTGLDGDAVRQVLLRQNLLIAGRDGKVPDVEKIRSGAPAERVYVLALAFIDSCVTM